MEIKLILTCIVPFIKEIIFGSKHDYEDEYMNWHRKIIVYISRSYRTINLLIITLILSIVMNGFFINKIIKLALQNNQTNRNELNTNIEKPEDDELEKIKEMIKKKYENQ